MTLKDLRLKAGLNQVDVAKRLHVTQTCVSKWEAGQRPAKHHLKAIARLYGVKETEIEWEVNET